MSWLKIDDGFPEHEKVMDLSDRAFRVHMVALAQCAKNLTDGLVDKRRLMVVRAIVNNPITGAVRDLVAAGLWIECEEGHMIRDYLEYNPDAATVKQMRKDRVDAGRRGGLAKAKANASPVATANGLVVASTPSRPLPLSSKAFVEPTQIKDLIDEALKEAW